jgi:hypothetical protein
MIPIERFRYSNFSYIRDQEKVIRLSDGTPTQKYYDTSTLNRFSYKKKFVNDRRIAAPSKVSFNVYYKLTQWCISWKFRKLFPSASSFNRLLLFR